MLDRTAKIRGKSCYCAASASNVDHPKFALHRVLPCTGAVRHRRATGGSPSCPFGSATALAHMRLLQIYPPQRHNPEWKPIPGHSNPPQAREMWRIRSCRNPLPVRLVALWRIEIRWPSARIRTTTIRVQSTTLLLTPTSEQPCCNSKAKCRRPRLSEWPNVNSNLSRARWPTRGHDRDDAHVHLESCSAAPQPLSREPARGYEMSPL